MKKLYILLPALLIASATFAQAPQKMSYQAVVRKTDNSLVTNTSIGMQVSILQGSTDGTAVYVERHTTSTNANGLVTIEVGTGTVVSGNFASIDWANGPYYFKTETDPAGGTSYTISGTSQLLSVPYALHAQTADELSGGVTETDPVFTAWDKSSGILISVNQVTDLENFADTLSQHFNFEGLQNGDLLMYNGTQWVKFTPSYLTSFTETDPAVAANFSFAGAATGDLLQFDGSRWVKFTPTYLSSFNETDPIFTEWDKSTGITITSEQVTGLATVATTGNYSDLTDTPQGTEVGQMHYWSGSDWVNLNTGTDGQILMVREGIPQWVTYAPGLAIIETKEVNSITLTSALVVSEIVSEGGNAVTERGILWDTEPDLNINDANKIANGLSSGLYGTEISGLSLWTTYYTRAYAINSAGTAYGVELNFKTLNTPTVITESVDNITATSAQFNGNITDDGGSSITDRGFVWSTSENPSIESNDGQISVDNGIGLFNATASELNSNTTYYLKAYGTNSTGTYYGNQISFTSLPTDGDMGSVTDIDNNTYQTVYIGGKWWMAENLKVSNYNNGDNIGENRVVYPSSEIDGLNSEIEVLETYGALYSYNAVQDNRGLCPTGWHVPSDNEWHELILYIDPDAILDEYTESLVAGGILKSSRTAPEEHPRWEFPNTDATDTYGFSAIPSGVREYWDFDGTYVYNGIGYYTGWRCADNYMCRWINYNSSKITRGEPNPDFNLSVRCVKDN